MKLMCTYKFVACLYMLCDVLHIVAKLQGSLQAKELDLANVPVLVKGGDPSGPRIFLKN